MKTENLGILTASMFLGLSGLLSLNGCTSAKSSLMEYDKPMERSRSRGDCLESEEFSIFRYQGGVCMATVSLYEECPSRERILVREGLTYVAIPPEGGSGCAGVQAQVDFFSEEAFMKEEEYLAILRHVAERLRSERMQQSEELLELGEDVARELLATGMAGLVSISIDPSSHFADIDRYRIVFRLNDSGRAVVALVDEDGADLEWARLLD